MFAWLILQYQDSAKPFPLTRSMTSAVQVALNVSCASCQQVHPMA